MGKNTLMGQDTINQKELIYEELKKLYEPTSKVKRDNDLSWDVIDE